MGRFVVVVIRNRLVSVVIIVVAVAVVVATSLIFKANIKFGYITNFRQKLTLKSIIFVINNAFFKKLTFN